MQTLRKKTSPLKYKNETTKFLGDGVSFKAKLIGILEVSEARGDRMCQEALSDLKMAIRAAGEHKQRITINIAIDGLRLRDEKTGDSLYHHPVHKISFIAQDMTDSRAFGYIFGSPDTGHRFFGIKTDKAASQVVIAMRDLFQVVFALKKKEIELAKQHLDKNRFTSSPLFSDSSTSSPNKLQPLTQDNTKSISSDSKVGASSELKPEGTAVADLVDLELELSSLQQGLNQMERITPSEPFVGSKDDPFGDSFISYTKPFLPPPPSSGRERSSRTTSESSGGLFSPRTPRTTCDNNVTLFSSKDSKESEDWFQHPKSIFEEPPIVPELTKDEKHEMTKQEILSQFDVFTDLDPLGTGKIKPYVDKKHFFQELKNPPKKVLNDLVPKCVDRSVTFPKQSSDFASDDPFGEDPFVTEDPFADFGRNDPFETEFLPKSSDFDFKFDQNQEALKGVHFEQNKLMRLHENASVDISSESESAPEPPPRPDSTLSKPPPPLPPKKLGEFCAKPPPPRPPSDIGEQLETPPIPRPLRKSKFESDFVPERPKKTEEPYLTPISLDDSKSSLPPPQKPKKNVTLDNLPSLEGLDITLSQLTLSGLNELASKLNIPANQLSNMTLVQLTNYLSNFIKSKSSNEILEANTETAFNADFAANFNNLNNSTAAGSYDRYAVFRELMNEEIKQTKIDTEPEELQEEQKAVDSNVNNIYGSANADESVTDKYAALREIVESELKEDDNKNETKQNSFNEQADETTFNLENDEKASPKYNLIEYNIALDTKDVKANNASPKSPLNKAIKSPVPIAITEIKQNNVRLNSGSLSDAVSGSSPEVDNTGSNSEVKKIEDAAGESWAIFEHRLPSEPIKATTQSEEGVSPWSSDSKEFGNGSPSEWQRGDSESGGDQWTRRRLRNDQEGWWDTSAEPEVQYYPSNRRSTDNYECYERPARRRKQAAYTTPAQAPGTGGHSSSSRDVSPWEEEPRRASWMKPARQHSADKYRERRLANSWDDEDDYEYEEERVPRFHRGERPKREMERERYDSANREHNIDKWNDDRRYRRRREGERERWCYPDWEMDEHEKAGRYGASRWLPPDANWRDRKHDERYYSRESQESPWEDEAEELSSSHYVAAKRNWKRPSSASEMDRKTGDIRSRHYFMTGGSDGERDRRYKPNRRSRSRDSQYSEPTHRHKTDSGLSSRGPHRNKPYSKQPLDNDFIDKKPLDDHKKSATLTSRKKTKEGPKCETGTFPRKSTPRSKLLFENAFPSTEESTSPNFNFENEFEASETESPVKPLKGEFRQNSLFERSHLESGFNREHGRQRSLKESKLSPKFQNRTLLDDEISSKLTMGEPLPKDSSISSIKEEVDPKSESSFSTNHLENATNCRKKKINKHKQSDIHIKKSESVNIFARESDPFDDDFFSENVSEDAHQSTEKSFKSTDLRWTEEFEEFPEEESK